MRKGPPRLVDWLATLLLFGGLALGGAPRAAEAVAGTVVRDLYYGEALFHFYQRDDFTALTHLLAAREAGRLAHHDAEAQLLAGGLYLSYGQHRRAAEVFEQLLAAGATGATRDRAWFYLGKVRYQRGLYREALAALGRVGGALPEALAMERPMLVAQSHMALGEWAEAGRVLATWEAPAQWLGYARFNLGVALVRLGHLDEGAALLDRVGRMSAATAEEKSLRDKANLALGYAWLQAGDAGAAKPALQRVRLHGPFSSKALLGAGWADALAADYRTALVPWQELEGRDLLDGAVQEAYLARPYALARLEAQGAAIAGYEQALATYDDEIARLAAAAARARAGSLLPALLAADDPELGRWYWQLDAVPDNEDSRYLYPLLAHHAFQEGMKNYRDLRFLERHLQGWQESLDAYTAMIEARAAAYAGRQPAAARRLAAADVDALAARHADLAARLQRARTERDIVALADAAEGDRWQRLQALGADPRLREPEHAGLAARRRVLQGVLLWDLDRRFKERQWRAGRELAQVAAALEGAQARVAAVNATSDTEPQRFAALGARIVAAGPRIAALQESIGRARRHQEGELVALAVRELESQQQRLASYRVQARFALATLYDRAGGAHAVAVAPASEPAP